MYKKWSVLGLAAAVVLTAAAPGLSASPPSGDGSILPPEARPYGQSLGGWLEDYWRYSLTNPSFPEPFQPGPARIVYMPVPVGVYQGGSGTSDDPAYLKGTIDVEIPPGTAFVLPLFAWIAERYNTGQVDDPTIPNDRIQSTVVHPSGTGIPLVTLDDQPILQNFWDYYVGPIAFDPVVTYPEPTEYGSIAAVAFQGVGFVAAPLPPGMHTLHLLERLKITNADLPGYPSDIDVGVIYDNTWNINVEK